MMMTKYGDYSYSRNRRILCSPLLLTPHLLQNDLNEFEESLRFFLETCDRFGGMHALVDETFGDFAKLALELAVDETKCKIFAVGFLDQATSPEAALCAAELGQVVTSFVPILAKQTGSSGLALDLATWPHRYDETMEMTVNFGPIFGNSFACMPRLTHATRTIGASSNPVDSSYFGFLPVGSARTRGRRVVVTRGDWTYDYDDLAIVCNGFDTHARQVKTLSKFPTTSEFVSLTLDDGMIAWQSSLIEVLKDRSGLELIRRRQLEAEEVYDWTETWRGAIES